MSKSIDDIIKEMNIQMNNKRVVESLQREELSRQIFERNELYRQNRLRELDQIGGSIKKYITPGYIIDGYFI